MMIKINKIELGNFLIITMLFLGSFILPSLANASNYEPEATTKSASNITSDTATLNGRVDGNDSYTSAWFEYGRNKDLDNSTPEK
jgi:hypothetical protein